MLKNKSFLFLAFLLITTSIFLTAFLVQKTQFFGKFAEEKTASLTFNLTPQKPINQIWQNFSQGGEEPSLMLKPLTSQIRSLQPRYIRIDHLFDFPNLDARVQEIVDIGAKPFLALSYFPASMSPDLVTFPSSLDPWQKLVEQTIQNYSGKGSKNLTDVYYEVWNEPDLFGKMSPGQYFSLYQASLKAAESCQNCNAFKIGGPAITTLKKDWMNSFLSLVAQNNLRLDFISWHSYQLNPEKTLWEAESIRNFKNTYPGFRNSELIISEWGSLPEVSPLHDSYFDASHTVWAIDQLKNSVDKLFTFEIVDGPDPAGKNLWGRWGLFTKSLQAKPRYYPYVYLSKLLDYELLGLNTSDEVTAIGSSNGRENYSFIVSRQKGKSKILPFSLVLDKALPGIYNVNAYFLDSLHQPLTPQTQTLTSNTDLTLDLNLNVNAVVLLEINRTSPALIVAKGRTEEPSDSSAKLSPNTPPLVFALNQLKDIKQLEISFWLKPESILESNQTFSLFESRNSSGDGLSGWYENAPSPLLRLALFKNNQILEEASLPLEPLSAESWQKLTFAYDSINHTLAIGLNNQQSLTQISQPSRFGKTLTIGNNQDRTNSFSGFIDDVTIKINQETVYQKSF